MHEQTIGIPVTLKIDLPFEGWITVEAEVVYRKEAFGFAVRFLGMDQSTSAQPSRRRESGLKKMAARQREGRKKKGSS